MKPGTSGWVDHVVTPVGALALIVAEDTLDRYFVKWVEERTGNRVWRASLRMLFNPAAASPMWPASARGIARTGRSTGSTDQRISWFLPCRSRTRGVGSCTGGCDGGRKSAHPACSCTVDKHGEWESLLQRILQEERRANRAPVRVPSSWLSLIRLQADHDWNGLHFPQQRLTGMKRADEAA
jgi:hypothetical protein